MESLGVLAGGIAHDFNNLLMGIMGNADLALLDLPADAPLAARLHNIADGARRAAELCRQMLDFSGRGQLAVELLDLNELIREMCGMLRVTIGKDTDLRYDFAGDVPRVIGDSTQIRQVIMNLVLNASEAIGNASGTVTVRTGKRACSSSYLRSLPFAEKAREGDFSFVEVEDTGCGMDRATQERIFEPYFTTKAAGSGLGMGIVLGVVKAHRAALVFDSVAGRGSRFRVLFPVALPGSEASQP
jgi:signal transduction histidine kinase